MPRNVFRRLAQLRARMGSEADALPGDAVQHIAGGRLGFVESVSGEVATVFWHTNPGHREIIEVKYLRRASADPAFGPDVKEAP
jgi:hypothetical protein